MWRSNSNQARQVGSRDALCARKINFGSIHQDCWTEPRDRFPLTISLATIDDGEANIRCFGIRGFRVFSPCLLSMYWLPPASVKSRDNYTKCRNQARRTKDSSQRRTRPETSKQQEQQRNSGSGRLKGSGNAPSNTMSRTERLNGRRKFYHRDRLSQVDKRMKRIGPKNDLEPECNRIRIRYSKRTEWD